MAKKSPRGLGFGSGFGTRSRGGLGLGSGFGTRKLGVDPEPRKASKKAKAKRTAKAKRRRQAAPVKRRVRPRVRRTVAPIRRVSGRSGRRIARAAMPSGSMTFLELAELYADERSAIRYFEQRRWPDGRTCPRCSSDSTYNTHTKGVHLPLYKCRRCGRNFNVATDTIMQGTHLPFRLWLYAFHLVGSSKKSVSSHQLARMTGVTVKTAWHLMHRLRATMTDDSQKFVGIVESDEAYIGGKRKHHGRGYRGNKAAVQTIIKRGTRTTRSEDTGHITIL